MNHPRRHVLCAALIATLMIARAGGEQLTSHDDRIQLEIPDDYAPTKTPPAPFTLEASSRESNAAVLLLTEPKASHPDLKTAAGAMQQDLLAKLRDGQSDEGKPLAIGECSALRYEITGINAKGRRVAFVVTVIQTQTRYCEVACCCPRAQLADLRKEFNAIADSLKERPAKPH